MEMQTAASAGVPRHQTLAFVELPVERQIGHLVLIPHPEQILLQRLARITVPAMEDTLLLDILVRLLVDMGIVAMADTFLLDRMVTILVDRTVSSVTTADRLEAESAVGNI